MEWSEVVKPGRTSTGWWSPRPNARSQGDDAMKAPISHSMRCSSAKRPTDRGSNGRRSSARGATTSALAAGQLAAQVRPQQLARGRVGKLVPEEDLVGGLGAAQLLLGERADVLRGHRGGRDHDGGDGLA